MGDKVFENMGGKRLKTSEKLKTFLDYLDSVESEYEYCQNEVEIENKRLQDFLHKIELEERCEVRSKACTEFRKQRIHRRKCKDRIGELDPIIKILRTKDYQRVRNSFAQALGAIRNFEKYEANRQYYPRIKE